jgi:hypothetical protein
MEEGAFDFTDLSLPQYVPMHKYIFREFEQVSKVVSAIDIDKAIKTIHDDVNKYVDFMVDNDMVDGTDPFFSQSYENMRKLCITQITYNRLKTVLDQCKLEIKESRDNDPELSLETWNEVRHLSLPQFGDFIIEKFGNFQITPETLEQDLKSVPQLYDVKCIPFILQNPDEPIPDDKEDDDLNVSGGKISLKDPISLQPFKDPVTSTCGHTFEKDVINQMEGVDFACPISGCARRIVKTQLVPDFIMSVRARAFQSMQKSNRNDHVPVL